MLMDWGQGQDAPGFGGLGDMSPSSKAQSCLRTPHWGDFWAGGGDTEIVGVVELIGFEASYGLQQCNGSWLVGRYQDANNMHCQR